MNGAEAMSSLAAAWEALYALVIAYAFSALGAIVLLIAGYMIAGIAERSANAALSRIRGFDETLRGFLSRALRYAMLILVGVTVLAQFGVQTASILAALGAAGLAIGLALQGTLQNIAAGIMLLVLKPFRSGEYIVAGDVSGTIQEIGLFATELKTADGIYVLTPNSELWSTPVTNYSRNATRRADLAIGIGYGDDIALATETLLALARAEARVLTAPAAEAFVSELGDSAVVVTLRYWTRSADWWSTRLGLTRAAKLAFDEKGISIPYPQQDVHMIANPAATERADA
ncbi:MAG: mechanosensitive ion channel family protein [Rhizobiaceae bacterium]|nr:mechanosensitive ion channel family protein [Rhizobiaceae bacterium]